MLTVPTIPSLIETFALQREKYTFFPDQFGPAGCHEARKPIRKSVRSVQTDFSSNTIHEYPACVLQRLCSIGFIAITDVVDCLPREGKTVAAHSKWRHVYCFGINEPARVARRWGSNFSARIRADKCIHVCSISLRSFMACKIQFLKLFGHSSFFIKLGNAWYTNAGDCHTQYFFKSMRLMLKEYFKYKINDLVIFIHNSLCSKLLPLIFYKYSRYLELTLVLLIMDYWL